MASTAAECRELEWGEGALNNLVTYAATALEGAEKAALVVKACELHALTGRIREGQVERERLLWDGGVVRLREGTL